MRDELLLDLASRQHGLVTATQMRSLGFPDEAFADRAAGCNWDAITDEVLRRSGVPGGRGQDALVAVLDSGPGAALAYSSAAAWWRVPGCVLRPRHVVRTSRTARRPSTVEHLHTVRRLPDRWVTLLDAVPIVRPELLALQLFAQFRDERAERHVDALWSMRLLSSGSLVVLLDDLGGRGRDGVAGLRRFVAARGEGYVPPASGLEGRAIRILAGAGVVMRRQVDTGGDQWDGRVDLRHVDEAMVAEIQSERYHRALSSQRDDDDRRDRLRAAGFVVVELWDEQIWNRPHEVVDRVRAGIDEARRARLSGNAAVTVPFCSSESGTDPGF